MVLSVGVQPDLKKDNYTHFIKNPDVSKANWYNHDSVVGNIRFADIYNYYIIIIPFQFTFC